MDLRQQRAILPFNQWWNQDGNEVPIRFQVLLMQERRIGGFEYKIGTIVTHLSPQDWCELHGYILVEVYHGNRKALPGEQTELF